MLAIVGVEIRVEGGGTPAHFYIKVLRVKP
jgi:hypothetical protein